MSWDDMITIGVTGSRDFGPKESWAVWRILAGIEDEVCGRQVRFINGECPYGGLDLIAASWAAGAGWEVDGFPAEANAGWAYAKRNQKMVDEKPDLFLCFFKEGAGNRGTTMTRNMAKAAGLRVREYTL